MSRLHGHEGVGRFIHAFHAESGLSLEQLKHIAEDGRAPDFAGRAQLLLGEVERAMAEYGTLTDADLDAVLKRAGEFADAYVAHGRDTAAG